MHIYIYMPVYMFTVYDDAQARLSVCGLLMYFKKYFLGKDFLKVLFVF